MKRSSRLMLAVMAVLAAAAMCVARLSASKNIPADAIAVIYTADGLVGLYAVSPSGSPPIALITSRTAPGWFVSAWQVVQVAPPGLTHQNGLFDPAWTADGSVITYRSQQAGQYCDEINRLSLSKARPELVDCLEIDPGAEAVDWSPDGRYFAYAHRARTRVEIIILDTLKSVRSYIYADGPVWGLAWSPDSTRLAAAVGSEQSVQVYSAEGSVVARHAAAGAAFGKPAWSVQGTGLAFFCMSEYQIRICMVDLEDHTESMIAFPFRFPYIKKNLQWSPDGTRFVFEAVMPTGFNDLFAIHVDGSGLQQITSDPLGDSEPAWSPDGEQIAFISMRDGNRELYLIRPDGTDLRRLTHTPGDESSPVWRPHP